MTEKSIRHPKWSSPLAPYLAVNDARNAIRFYKEAFEATVVVGPLEMPGGLIGHCEMRIGDGTIMLADGGMPEELVDTPNNVGSSTTQLLVYLPDADAAFDRAVAAGAEVVRPMADSFDGARQGKVRDPFGHNWFLTTVVEEISKAELHRRMDDLFS